MSFEYNKEIGEPPTFLDLNFIQDVTENALREQDVKVMKAHVKLGSAIGENFCSKVYRINIKYELIAENNKKEEISVIVKCITPIEGVNFIDELKFFEKEKITFEEVLPKINAFLEPGKSFSGRVYHHLKRPVNVLAFEDLSVSGFQMVSQSKGLDEKHARLVLNRIGQFHAISMHLAKRDTFIPKFYSSGFLSEPAVRSGAFMHTHCSGTSKAVQKLAVKLDYSDIAVKLQKYRDNLTESLVKFHALRPDDHLRVLNHGDLWVNNLLFKYDENNKVIDIAFIDFQLTYWGSPGVDLNYFLYTSLQLDVLKNKREELLLEYYSSLRAKLIELKYTPLPTFEQIREEVRRRAGVGLFANHAVYPIISQDKSKSGDSSLDNLADKDFAEKKNDEIFSSKQMEDNFRYTLKEFDRMGVWD